MEKENIKKILIKIKTPDNEIKVDNLLKLLDQMSDEELHIKLKQLNLSENNIEQYLSSLIVKTKNQEETSERFVNINDWFCCGRTGDTIHLHLIPKDLRGIKKELGDEEFYNLFKKQLEDFLSRIQIMFSEDTSVKTLFAVSPIFYNPNISSIHESLGFDKVIEVDLNNKNDNMSIEQKQFFLNMFNKGNNNRKVYYTKMTREKLLETTYMQEENIHLKH